MAEVARSPYDQPFRDWIQARLDKFFYRDRLDYRRTSFEFAARSLPKCARPHARFGADRIFRRALLVEPPGGFHGRGNPTRHVPPWRGPSACVYAGHSIRVFWYEEKPFSHRVLFNQSARAARESTPSSGKRSNNST